MKKIAFFLIILIAASVGFAQTPQEKPLSQAEYVRMLNELLRNPKMKEEIVESVRRRGVSFPVTDGLIALTRTKSGSDAELIRTLKEAGRRKDNPTEFQLPPTKEVKEILEKSRTATLAAVEEMPDFVVKQMIQRGISYAGTSNFKNLDKLVVAVSYRSPDVSGANGAEEYRVLSIDGIIQTDTKPKGSFFDLGGTSSTGEFVTRLALIFNQGSETKFDVLTTDVVRGRRTIVYNYSIKKDKAFNLIFSANSNIISGLDGKVWVDRENFRVLRMESVATEIPNDFDVRAVNRVIDYDWVTINNEKYLLPLYSDVRMTLKAGRETYETRNLIRFKEYQKFGSEVKILDDDLEVKEEKPIP